MRKRLTLLLISTLMTTACAHADVGLSGAEDFTGEAFFEPPLLEQPNSAKSSSDKEGLHNSTTPPIKLLRLRLKNASDRRELKKYELAPTAEEVYSGEVETSEFASQEVKDDFEEMAPDGFETDEENLEENNATKKGWFGKKKKKEVAESEKEDIILDCEKVDYDTENYLIYATGNVNVQFVKQGTIVEADVITFDRMNNTVKAEGNVKILKGGQTITGDYIFVDMNEENALIENPLTQTDFIVIKSQKGYVYGDKIVQENGDITVDKSFPINFSSGTRGPRISKMLVPKGDTLSEDMANGIVTLKVQDIKITQKGDLEIIEITKPQLFKGDKKVFKTKSAKIYTNKNHDYAETNHWEIGAYRGLGLYAGPGVVFELPKGSVLKAVPMLNYKSGLGVGAMTRFSSGTNHTLAAYGSAEDRFIVYGKQNLDDNLFLEYSVNGFMDEWFMGRRRPKYGTSLVYSNGYSADSFLLKGQTSSFRHRFDAGYYQDLDFDSKHERLQGSNIGTTRFRYMAQVNQTFYRYLNEEKLKAFSIGMVSQLSSAIYGTGDTQIVGRIGPNVHMQYKRWMQDVGYLYSVYDDNTPLTAFDTYRYGKQTLYLREYLRLCRWLTVSWFSSINLSNDAANGRDMQENTFYFSFGPDDLKFNIGYDFVRENLRCTFEVMMDAKGTNVQYETLEIKQDKKKTEKKKEEPVAKKENQYAAPTQPRVLEKAVVENVKEHEDVL